MITKHFSNVLNGLDKMASTMESRGNTGQAIMLDGIFRKIASNYAQLRKLANYGKFEHDVDRLFSEYPHVDWKSKNFLMNRVLSRITANSDDRGNYGLTSAIPDEFFDTQIAYMRRQLDAFSELPSRDIRDIELTPEEMEEAGRHPSHEERRRMEDSID